MKKKLIWIGVAVAGYFLLLKPKKDPSIAQGISERAPAPKRAITPQASTA